MSEKRFEKAQRERFDKHLWQVQEFIRLDAPNVILAAAVWHMFQAALGFMGDDLAKQMLETTIENMRQRAAF